MALSANILGRVRFGAGALQTVATVGVRRAVRGPAHPQWDLKAEAAVEIARRLMHQVASVPPPEGRRLMDAAGLPPERLRSVEVRQGELGSVEGEWVAPAGATESPVILYLHGGGYTTGSPASHRALVAQIARQARARCFVPNYRLAPEHPFPAAVDDAFAVYEALTQQVPASSVFVAGDSAGGGLTMSLMLRLRELGRPLPRAAMLLSPWVDLTCPPGSIDDNAKHCYLTRSMLEAAAAGYALGVDATDPRVSPVFADLSGLPPLLIQAGGAELLRDEGLRLAQAAESAGVDVSFEEWPAMVHVWHTLGAVVADGKAAVQRIGEFVRAHAPDQNR